MRFVLIVLFVLMATSTQAQRYRVGQDKKKKKEYVYPSNVIKLNLSSAIFKALGVQYERKLASRFSFALGGIYRPSSSLFFFKTLSDNAGNSGISPETAAMYESARFSRLSITPELRFYFKKKAPKGLYLAPFFRYNRDQTRFDFKYSENNSTVRKTGQARLTENMIGGGILFGLQILSKKKLAVDLWFLGPWLGFNKATLKSGLNVGNINEFEKAVLASNIEPIIQDEALKWDNSGINTTISRTGLGVRLLGINIGYNF